jgi:sarcosine oxidase
MVTVTGGLMLGLESSVAVGGALATARAHGLAHEMLDAGEIRRRFPAFAPADDEVGLFEETAGLIRPERAIAAHLRQAREHGADLRTGVAVEDWAAGSDGVVVRTADGIIEADQLVLAPGAWALGLTRLPVGLRVQRRVQHYWRASRPELFAVGRLPVWIWEYDAELAAYGLPEVDGGVKAALHHGHEAADPGLGAAPVRQGEIEQMREWLSGHLPSLAEGAWVGAKPCLYTLTPDENFALGRHPVYPNVSVACGFSGHGFKFTPVVGEILADLVITGATRHPIDLFRPGRTDARPVTAPSGSGG